MAITLLVAAAPTVPAVRWWIPDAAAEAPRSVSNGPLLAFDGKTDLSSLERAALTRWAGAWEDPLVLLERREVEWTADHRRIETVHRAVRLPSDLAVERYADLRLAYDSLRTELAVLSLRTYRDGRWIESGPTAQVETTPDLLDRAVDLSWVRERMLLHDGVGLPCIVETVWRLTDAWPFRGGTEGVFVFAQEDPVVRAEFSFTSPAGTGMLETAGGAPSPLLERDDAGASERRAVRMEFLEPAGTVSLDAAAYLPHASWSTWADWPAYGAFLRDGFERALALDAALRDSVRVLAAEEATPAEIARSLAAFAARRVRLTACDEALQRPRPREAARVHATGYGSGFDRAALAAALFRQAGLEAEPLYRSRGFGSIDEGVPTLGRAQDLALILREPPDSLRGIAGAAEYLGIYDPVSGQVDFGTASMVGRTLWVPGRDRRPVLRGGADVGSSRLRVGFDLVPAEDDSSWSGDGYLEADGVFSPYGGFVGLGQEARERLEAITGSLLPAATVGGYNLAVLRPGRVVAGTSVAVKPQKRDDLGRRKIALGDPEGGIVSLLPGDVHLSDAGRRAPVMIPGSLRQELRLRLRLPADRVVCLPEAMRLQNRAGEFVVAVERDGERVTIVRTLHLSRARHEAADWPALRELLLADQGERNRVVLYR